MCGADGSRVCDSSTQLLLRPRRGGAGSHGRGKDNCTRVGQAVGARLRPRTYAPAPLPARAGNFVYSLALFWASSFSTSLVV
jgi:hypothetical protein